MHIEDPTVKDEDRKCSERDNGPVKQGVEGRELRKLNVTPVMDADCLPTSCHGLRIVSLVKFS